MSSITAKRWIVLINSLLFAAMLFWQPFEADVNKGLALLFFVAVLWLTEAIHISITALLVPVLAINLGVISTSSALKNFADPIIFLFLGGFGLASALHRQGLDKSIAAWVLGIAKGRLNIAIYLLFAVSAGLSMWISNTATAAMMLPLALGVLNQIEEGQQHETWIFTLLGIAYCSSIGGIATLVGSPPNAIAAAETGLTFMQWMQKAMPLTLILLPLAMLVLYWVIRPSLNHKVRTQTVAIEWDKNKILTLVIFAITVLCWIFSAPLNQWLGGIDSLDSLIALTALVALGAFGVVDWKDIEKTTDWGVLILFGGGLCLSAVLKSTGTSLFLAQTLGSWIGTAGMLVAIVAIVTFVVFLTEFASNTASAALLVPVFVGIAPSLGIDPVAIAVLIAVGASCAFMLPVATPPNAIVFGSGFVPQKAMMRAGLWLNLLCIVVLTLFAWLFW